MRSVPRVEAREVLDVEGDIKRGKLGGDELDRLQPPAAVPRTHIYLIRECVETRTGGFEVVDEGYVIARGLAARRRTLFTFKENKKKVDVSWSNFRSAISQI